MSNELLIIVPAHLQFHFELNKQSSCSVYLINKTDKTVAFKVKLNQKKYIVRPNAGVVLPRSSFQVLVIMRAQMDAPADMQCKDKFLFQCVVSGEARASTMNVTPRMFSKEVGHRVYKTILRVTYVAPPVIEGLEQDFGRVREPRASGISELQTVLSRFLKPLLSCFLLALAVSYRRLRFLIIKLSTALRRMSNELLTVVPDDNLQFHFESNKQSSCSVHLINKTDNADIEVKLRKQTKSFVRSNGVILSAVLVSCLLCFPMYNHLLWSHTESHASSVSSSGASVSDYENYSDLFEMLSLLAVSLATKGINLPQYQVFINFRGDELRNNFFGFLVKAMRLENINVFADEFEPRGSNLDSLFSRIEESEVAVAIFSERYTESSWCLDELVKMNEEMEQGKLVVVPVFYKVDPTACANLDGTFGDNFRKLERENRCERERIQKWKEALSSVVNIMGLKLDIGR